jgi:hypothetical protein
VADRLTTTDMLDLLSARYCLPKYALVTEVPNATSVSKSRTCDAMAFGCWSTVGIRIEGFEVKVSRSDWLKELNDRSKAATFEPFCHHWWIVAAPKVVRIEELPAEWGLLEPSGKGLKAKSAASLRTPEPMPVAMLSALVRRAIGGQSATAAIAMAERRGYERGLESGKAHGKTVNDISGWRGRYEDLQRSVDEFAQASGMRIRSYSGRKMGEAFAAFQRIPRCGVEDRDTIAILRNLLAMWDEFQAAWNKEVSG